MKPEEESIVQMVPMIGDGEHKLVVLTSRGRMFERSVDPRGNFNRRSGQPVVYQWVEFTGPLSKPAE